MLDWKMIEACLYGASESIRLESQLDDRSMTRPFSKPPSWWPCSYSQASVAYAPHVFCNNCLACWSIALQVSAGLARRHSGTGTQGSGCGNCLLPMLPSSHASSH